MGGRELLALCRWYDCLHNAGCLVQTKIQGNQ